MHPRRTPAPIHHWTSCLGGRGGARVRFGGGCMSALYRPVLPSEDTPDPPGSEFLDVDRLERDPTLRERLLVGRVQCTAALQVQLSGCRQLGHRHRQSGGRCSSSSPIRRTWTEDSQFTTVCSMLPRGAKHGQLPEARCLGGRPGASKPHEKYCKNIKFCLAFLRLRMSCCASTRCVWRRGGVFFLCSRVTTSTYYLFRFDHRLPGCLPRHGR